MCLVIDVTFSFALGINLRNSVVSTWHHDITTEKKWHNDLYNDWYEKSL
jgi:hypothetical protein